MAKKELSAKAETSIETASEQPKPRFNFVLQVINPFLSYYKGALIATDEAIQAVIDGGNLINCNRLSLK
jgi:hypothetical protein